MGPTRLQVALLCLLALPVVCCAVQVTVQANPDCSPNVTSSLDQALQSLTSDSVISLAGGVHCLTNFTVVSGISNVSIIGPQQENETAIITCSDEIGLVFVNILGLRFEHLQILDCGLTSDNLERAVNLTRELVQLNFNVPQKTQVAVYLADVKNLSMTHVTITNTTGLGLVGINVVGQSEIQSCTFSYNIQRQQECAFTDQQSYVTDRGERIGGGAYFLYQDFEGSNVSSCDIENKILYSLGIHQSQFIGNSECSDLATIEFNYRDSRRAKRDGYFIGGGGGVGVMFAQVCYAIDVDTTSTTFQGNSAIYGSAAHIGIFQGVSDSHATFDACQFTRNGYASSELDLNYTSNGGAIGLYNDLVSPDPSVPNFIHNRNIGMSVRNSNFTENGAINGGAVTIISLVTTAVADIADVAYFYFDNCIFSGNIGAHGATVLIQELKLHARILGIQVFFSDLTVSRNTIVSLASIISVASSDSTAVLDARAINLTLSGSCLFESNIGTALQGTDSIIGIDGDVRFINNTGLYGGGMNLNQFSFLVVLPNSSLEFISNAGRIRGGAMYVDQLRNSPFSSLYDCFLYFDYDQFEFCETCNFSVNRFTVRFINNTAVIGGTIYGSSLITCPWAIPLQSQYSNQNVLQILAQNFSDHFEFVPDPLGVENVQSPVSRVVIEDEEPVYSLAPGESVSLAIRPLDSLGQRIGALIGTYVALDQDTSTPSSLIGAIGPAGLHYIVNGSNRSSEFTIFGAQNVTTTKMVVYGLDLLGGRPAQTEIRVRVLVCPIGFEFDNSTFRCECSTELQERGVQCSTSNLTLIVPSGLWVGPVEGSTFAVADCIRGLCEPGAASISVRNSSIDFNVQCREGLNRGGVLCGSCRNGYSNVFGGIRCQRCPNRHAAIFILFLLLGALIIIFLIVFRINLSSGYLNGVLFWSNIVSLYEMILAPTQSQLGAAFLANWLTLNWGIETCFHEGMTALERSWWQLSFPLYLFFLMIVTRSLFNSRCFRRVDSKTAFATIEAFATLIIVCYVSILEFCLELLSRTEIYTDDDKTLLRWMVDPEVKYFRGVHGFLAFVACLLLAVYIIPFPLIFMFPTLLYKIKFFKKYKPIYDAIWNPYKPKFRFWLGLRLIFRWVPFIMVSFTSAATSTFVTGFFLTLLLFLQIQLQPFQSPWVNALDSSFLLNLVLLFLGSLFFNATSDNNDVRLQQLSTMRKATNYTTFLVTLAYVGVAIMLFYHLFARFPKLKEYLKKCVTKCREQKRIKSVLRVPQSPLEDSVNRVSDYIQSTSVLTVPPGGPNFTGVLNSPVQKVRVISHTSFREPLLDEGSVEIETYTTTYS